MLIDRLNLNHLRIFECVYRTQSMTQAAKEMHLTQSGVSQHMRALEDVLEIRLFDRIKQRLVPTDSAHALYEKCKNALGDIEATLAEIKGGRNELYGKVTLGIPIEFGNNVITPILAKFARENPSVRFQLHYGFVTELQDLLLSGKMDFAFIDQFQTDSRIETERVFDEILELCASPDYVKSLGAFKESRKGFEELVYVEYQPGEPILRSWMKHHVGTDFLKLNVRVTAMDVQGIARFILSGLAAGILPGYLIEKLETEGQRLHRFKGSGTPLKNAISIAKLKGRSHSRVVQAVIKALMAGIRAAPAGL
jgi:DNA-binding transcriptional LysR family regulator